MRLLLTLLFGLTAAGVASARQSAPAKAAPADTRIVAIGPGRDVVLPEPDIHPVRRVPKIVGWPAGRTPAAPPGFRVTLFADNLEFPRWIYVLPNGDVLITEAGGEEKDRQQIVLFRDVDDHGIAKVREVFLSGGLKRPHGMLLLGNRFYVGNTDRLVAFPYKSGQTKITAAAEKIADLPTGGLHTTRNIAASPDGSKLYIGVGSFSDSDLDAASLHEPERAVILEMNPDGSGRRVFASGIRSPLGLDIEPETKALWVVVNERGGLGDQVPPDFFTSVRQGAFYGWPYFYWGRYKETRLNRPFPSDLPTPVVPDYALGSHVAPLGLTFYRGSSFPSQYRGGAFIAEHGSSGRSATLGGKVVYLPFVNGQPKGLPQDFLTDFVANEATAEVHGRPVGVAVMADGSLLVSDDGAGKVWKVSAIR